MATTEQAGHTDQLWAAAFTPDSATALTASFDGTAIAWACADGTPVTRFVGHTRAVFCVAASPDGHLVATGGRDYTIRTWNHLSGEQIHCLNGHTGAIRDVLFTNEGNIVSASHDKTIRMWSLEGHPIATLRGHTYTVTSLALLPGNRLVSGSWDRTIRVWDLTSGLELACLDAGTLCMDVACVGERIFWGCEHSGIKQWDLGRDKQIAEPIRLPEYIWSMAVSQDCSMVLTGGSGQVGLTTLPAGNYRPLAQEHVGGVRGCAISPDVTLGISAGTDGRANLWNLESGDLQLTFEGSCTSASALAVTSDGRHAFTGGWDGHLIRHDRNGDMFEPASVTLPHLPARAFDMQITSDDTCLVIGGGDGVYIVDLTTAELTHHLNQGVYHLGAELTLDGRNVAVNGSDGNVTVWRLDDGTLVSTLTGAGGFGLGLHPDGVHAICGLQDGSVGVWHLHTGEFLRPLCQLPDPIARLAVSVRGDQIAVGCGGGALPVYAFGSGEHIADPDPQAAWIRSMRYTSDGRCLVTASEDRTVKIFDTSSYQEVNHSGINDFLMTVVLTPDNEIIAADPQGGVRQLQADKL
jgi:WD40 repeat protein